MIIIYFERIGKHGKNNWIENNEQRFWWLGAASEKYFNESESPKWAWEKPTQPTHRSADPPTDLCLF